MDLRPAFSGVHLADDTGFLAALLYMLLCMTGGVAGFLCGVGVYMNISGYTLVRKLYTTATRSVAVVSSAHLAIVVAGACGVTHPVIADWHGAMRDATVFGAMTAVGLDAVSNDLNAVNIAYTVGTLLLLQVKGA
jgi:hypothetical protein